MPYSIECTPNESPALLFTPIKDLSEAQKSAILTQYGDNEHTSVDKFIEAQIAMPTHITLDARGATPQAVEQWLEQYLSGVAAIFNDWRKGEPKDTYSEEAQSNTRLIEKLLFENDVLEIHMVSSPAQEKALSALGKRLEQFRQEYADLLDNAHIYSRWNVLPVPASEQRSADEITHEYRNAEALVRIAQKSGQDHAHFAREAKKNPPTVEQIAEFENATPITPPEWAEGWWENYEEECRQVAENERINRPQRVAELRQAGHVLQRYGRLKDTDDKALDR